MFNFLIVVKIMTTTDAWKECSQVTSCISEILKNRNLKCMIINMHQHWNVLV